MQHSKAVHFLRKSCSKVHDTVTSFLRKLGKNSSKKANETISSTHALLRRFGGVLVRVAIIAFFIGFNISLGKAFAAQNDLRIPFPIVSLLLRYGVVPGEEVAIQQLTNPYQKEIVLDPAEVIAEINAIRTENNLPLFVANDQLATAAAVLLQDLAAYEYDLAAEGEVTPLGDVLEEVQYPYLWVHHNALVGPLSAKAAVTAWMSDVDQEKALLTKEFTDIGLAVAVVETPFMGKAGVIVQLLAQPQSTQKKLGALAGTQPAVSQQPKKLTEFSDQAVIDALNAYRATHGVAQLRIDPHLCTYAAKRVRDLVAHGSLDNHEGFKADFEKEDPPVGIAEYGAGTIGENLASQYCINGTTGQTIYAEHPTQLVEWCFDSSQKGHREAQLSSTYRDVCVRHGDNMYVVIFGAK